MKLGYTDGVELYVITGVKELRFVRGGLYLRTADGERYLNPGEADGAAVVNETVRGDLPRDDVRTATLVGEGEGRR